MTKDKLVLKKKVSKTMSKEAKKKGGKIQKNSKVARDQSLVDSLREISKKESARIQSKIAKTQEGKIKKYSIESTIQSIADSKGR